MQVRSVAFSTTNSYIIHSIFLLVFVLLLGACNDDDRRNEWRVGEQLTQTTKRAGETTLTIGDIDPDTPTTRMHKLRPLAWYLARGLDWDESRVKIRIVKSIEEASALLANNEIDIYMDSSYPSLLVSAKSGTKVILEAPVLGKRTYKSLIISSANSTVRSLDDLQGKTVALQELYSTSGYLLPAVLLVKNGFSLSKSATLPKGQSLSEKPIRVIFSGDEENTLIMIRKGLVAAGAISSHDFEKLSAQVKNELIVLSETQEAPRKLISVRNGLNETLIKQVVNLLLSIDDSDRAQMKKEKGWGWKFLNLDQQSHAGIHNIEEMITFIESTTDKITQ